MLGRADVPALLSQEDQLFAAVLGQIEQEIAGCGMFPILA
jgi:hypothetical protein